MNQLLHYLQQYWAIPALIVWGSLCLGLGLLGLDPFGIDEQAARGLLLNWSIADNIINPIVLYQLPDFRAILFIPIGTYWAGSMLAAKIMAIIIAFCAIAMLYRWALVVSNKETALIASALFAIAPFTINQLDALGAAPYILLCFTIGAWLDKAYRNKADYFGGWYFIQLIWVFIILTLHPLALAYPLTIAWFWYKRPHEHKNSRHMYVGLGLAALFSLSMRAGWTDMSWLANPIQTLAVALNGNVLWSTADIVWLPGIIAFGLLCLIAITDRAFLKQDLLGFMIILSIAIGIFAADATWAMIVGALVIYRGGHWLIVLNSKAKKPGLVGQRGWVIALSFVLTTYFMLQDKTHALAHQQASLSPEDQVIQSLAESALDTDQPFRAASQWPARTMLVCRRDVLPLPSNQVFSGHEELKDMVKGITHLAFDPDNPDNKALRDNLAALSGEIETLALLKGGVVLKNRNHNVELSGSHRPPVKPSENTTHPPEDAVRPTTDSTKSELGMHTD